MMPESVCSHCGGRLTAAGLCMKCLLETGLSKGGESRAERLFQMALAYSPEEREAFIRQAAGGDTELLADLSLLLQGHEEAGGDSALPTLGNAVDSRAAWALGGGGEPGMIIGPFHLVRVIGSGGMGMVWEAEQRVPVRRKVALKVIKLGMDTREVVTRFERERQALAMMKHPNIAQVYEAGATDTGRPWFAMELVEGIPLHEYCAAESLTVSRKLRLFLSVCAGVEHAHQKGIIHRDLKPSNILVESDGVPKVIDFGVAKATRETGDPLVTRAVQMLGTPAYMSPEQAASDGADVDTRSDVYSLGVVLYELLCGVLPFDPERLASTGVPEMRRILREETPRRPSTRLHARPGVPSPQKNDGELRGDLDWIVMKALSKERERRYTGAAALAEDIRRHLGGKPVLAAPPALSYQVRKFIGRNRVAALTGGLVLASLVTALLVSLTQTRRANTALAGESAARRQTTLTVADLYTRSGLAAADAGQPERAALWFAQAAVTAASGDPERLSANRLRADTWRREFPDVVRALDTGSRSAAKLAWHPGGKAILVIFPKGASEIWRLEDETRWRPPGSGGEMARASWNSDGSLLAAERDGGVTVMAWPSGAEIHRFPDTSATSLQWSPRGPWLGVTGPAASWLWNAETGLTCPLEKGVTGLRFSPEGERVLVEKETTAGVRALTAPTVALFPPVPRNPRWPSGFLGQDGATFFAGSAEGFDVWNAATGAREGMFDHPRGGPFDDLDPTAVSPDGRFISLMGSEVIDRGQPEKVVFPQHLNTHSTAAYSQDGRWLASGSYDATVKLWPLPSGRPPVNVGPIRSAVPALAFSPDSRLLASAEAGFVRIWDVAPHSPLRPLAVPADAASDAVLSADGRLLAFSGGTHHMAGLAATRVLALPSGEPVGPEIQPGGLILDAAFSPDGAWLALAVCAGRMEQRKTLHEQNPGRVEVRDFRTGELMGPPIPLPCEPRGIAVHPTGKFIAAFCADGSGVEISTEDHSSRTLFPATGFQLPDATLNNGRCRYSADGRYLAAWGIYQKFHLWDRTTGTDLAPRQPGFNLFDLDLSGSMVVSASVDETNGIEFFDLGRGQEARPRLPWTNWPLLARFDPSGEKVLLGGMGKFAQVWDWKRGRPVGPGLPHEDQLMAGGFLPGSPWVVTGGHDLAVRFHDPVSGMPVRPPLRTRGLVARLLFSEAARTMVVCTFDHPRVMLVDLDQVFPKPELDPAAALRLAELDAWAGVRAGGGIDLFTDREWLARWRDFRREHPDFSGHRLQP